MISRNEEAHIAYQEIVLGVLEYHVDGLVFQDDLAQCHEITMVQFSIKLSSPRQHQDLHSLELRSTGQHQNRKLTMISLAPD